jgi:ketosteroid isomerase-like protein
MSNIDLVRECYDKFKRGDVPGLLALFDPNIEFRLAEGHPYHPGGKPWIGGGQITQYFFMKAGTDWQDWDIVIDEILETPGSVAVEGRYAGIFKPTGRSLDVQVCHIWRLQDGKVKSFHQYLDTARLQAVMGYAG